MKHRAISFFLWAVCSYLNAGEYYTAPAGRPEAGGAEDQPLDLQTAIGSATPVRPGDTVWMRGGLYVGNFVSVLKGEPGREIVVRGFPGERVTLDGSKESPELYPLTINGSWAVYRDFEVIHSSTWKPEAETPMGIQWTAPNVKLINLVIHDAGQGIGCWMGAHSAEIYGCLLYHNGIRPLEHGIYIQNDVKTGTKRIHDNIIFNNAGFGVHAYTQGGQLTGFDFQGNILFNNGSKQGDQTRYDNLLVGGKPPADQINVQSNYVYFSPEVSRWNLRFSYGDHQARPHGRIAVTDNYIVGGSGFTAEDWRGILFTNNLVACGAAPLTDCRPPPGIRADSYNWDFNRYFGTEKFGFRAQVYNYAGWKAVASLDAHSTFTSGMPVETVVFVRANQYEPKRANLVVYNWGLQDNVPVEATGVLNRGDSYEVLNAQDFFGQPVLKGIYQGEPLVLPMTNLSLSLPKGRATGPKATGPLFNVFVLRGREGR